MNSTDLILIGEIKTSGSIVVSDPLSTTKPLVLKIKPGIYDSYLIREKAVWSVNSEIFIVHRQAKGPLIFENTGKSFFVESGVAGVFNSKDFKKNLKNKIRLRNKEESQIRRFVQTNIESAKELKKNLDISNSNNEYNILEIKSRIQSVLDYRYNLRSRTLPSFMGKELSRYFIDIAFDCTKSKNDAGIYCQNKGFVSASGFGDGVYDVLVSTDKNENIEAVRINFY